MASANFTVNGASTPPAAEVSAGSTVNLALTSTVGVRTVSWSIVGSHAAASPGPAITPSGSPLGVTASFAMPAGDGQAYLAQAVVNNGVDDAGQYDAALTKRALVGVVDGLGSLPLSSNETNERSATHGYTERVNAATAGGTITVNQVVNALKDPVHTIATSNIALSGTYTLNGVALTVGMRVLPIGQSLAVNNRIWVVAAGAWSPASDMPNGATLKSGLNIIVSHGDFKNASIQLGNTTDPVVNTNGLQWTVKTYVPVDPAGADDGKLFAVTGSIPGLIDPSTLASNAIRVETVITTTVTHSGTLTYDTVALSAGMVVLDTGNSNAALRGLWTIAAGAWTRPSTVHIPGMVVAAKGGAYAAGKSWQLKAASPFTIGTTAQYWARTDGNAQDCKHSVSSATTVALTLQDGSTTFGLSRGKANCVTFTVKARRSGKYFVWKGYLDCDVAADGTVTTPSGGTSFIGDDAPKFMINGDGPTWALGFVRSNPAGLQVQLTTLDATAIAVSTKLTHETLADV